MRFVNARIVIFFTIIASVICTKPVDEYAVDYFPVAPVDETPIRHRMKVNQNGNVEIPQELIDKGLRPTFVYIHGHSSPLEQQLEHTQRYFSLKTNAETCCHYFVVDWSSMATTYMYPRAVWNTQPVVEMAANILDQIIPLGLISLATLTIIGHSMGAHISCMIATIYWKRYIDWLQPIEAFRSSHTEDETLTKLLIENASLVDKNDEIEDRSTGILPFYLDQTSFGGRNRLDDYLEMARNMRMVAVLGFMDPAGPLYSRIKETSNDGSLRVRTGRAIYTWAVHTSRYYGLPEPVADADFYPNGGRLQWNCVQKLHVISRKRIDFEVCSHVSALYLMWNTFDMRANAEKYIAVECTNRHESIVNFSSCQRALGDRRVYLMGGNVLEIEDADRPRGIFYLETRGDAENVYSIHPVNVRDFQYENRV